MQWQKSNFWQAADDGKCPVSAAELGGAALGHAAPKSMLLHHHAACAEHGDFFTFQFFRTAFSEKHIRSDKFIIHTIIDLSEGFCVLFDRFERLGHLDFVR